MVRASTGYFGEGAVSGDQFWWNEAHQTVVKNQWFWCAKAVFDLSFGLVNLDNLFVVAGK